jgi:hypothetical protein
VRAALLAGFQDAKYLKVGADGGDFEADNKLAVDVQKFSYGGAAGSVKASVVLSAKLLDSDGKLIDAQVFSADVPVADPGDVPAAVAALNAAFSTTGGDLIAWAMTTLDSSASAPSDKSGGAAPSDDDNGASGDQSAPADKSAPADQSAPTDKSTPADQSAPDSGAAPAVPSASRDATPPDQGTAPAGDQ